MHWMVWHFNRQFNEEHANLSIIATSLKDSTIAALSGTRIEKFGYSFQVPWAAVENEHAGKEVVSLRFNKGCAALLVFDPSSAIDGARLMQGSTARDHSIMNRILGAKTLSSNYDLMAAAVRARPDDVKWWNSRVQLAGSLIMLVQKSTDLVDVDSIHPVAIGSVRGFQFGDSDTAPYFVRLELFDNSDRHYRIWINGNHRAIITQGEINGLIASLHTLPSQSVNSSPATAMLSRNSILEK